MSILSGPARSHTILSGPPLQEPENCRFCRGRRPPARDHRTSIGAWQSKPGTCFGGMCPKMGQNCVTLAWELSHARAMDTIACATFLASGHTPKVCPYVSLGVTVTRNHYFSLCHSPDSAEWYYASYMHMGQKT